MADDEVLRPVAFDWDGDNMVPRRHHRKLCDEQYVIGQVYILIPLEERSAKSHRHYFACVNEAWINLPETAGDRFPTATHLRKYALIRTGYRDERTITCGSKAEALRVAAFIKPLDEFAVITVDHATVTVYTAKSQSEKAMGKLRFQESKDKVLGYLADVLETTPQRLSNAAGGNL